MGLHNFHNVLHYPCVKRPGDKWLFLYTLYCYINMIQTRNAFVVCNSLFPTYCFAFWLTNLPCSISSPLRVLWKLTACSVYPSTLFPCGQIKT
jgi:hypothetical protein